MPISNQKYAFVTQEGWETLKERWPDAPLYGNYRLLVFSGNQLPGLEEEYSDAEFKYLETQETIDAMLEGTIGPFICSLSQARDIAKHFTPETEE
jgi:hypothetical protein